jgi:hypothetical protein
MFPFRWWMAGRIGLGTTLTPLVAADLSTIGRTIGKEPEYKGKQQKQRSKRA